MTAPNRMARYEIRNDGIGPYAVFFCEKCAREFRSQPFTVASAVEARGKEIASDALEDIPLVGEALATSIGQADLGLGTLEERGREMLSDLLGNIPVVGEALAAGVGTAGAKNLALTPQQLEAAWDQVAAEFGECANCGRIVCLTDYDQSSGFCTEHTTRQPAATQPTDYEYPSVQSAAEPAPYGYEGTQSAAQPAPYGYEGAQPAPPGPAAPAPAAGITCASCGEAIAAGTKFCPNCGTKVEPPKPAGVCPSCGTAAPGARFCPSCGTKMSAD